MSDTEKLQTEVDGLRQQLEAYRQRELDALRGQLAEATASTAHYRAEAQRNADLGRQIHTEAQAEISRLVFRVQSLEQLPNARERLAGDR